jgi:hypothetical protein
MSLSHSQPKSQPDSPAQSRFLTAVIAAACVIAMLMGGLVAAPKAWADQSGALRIEIDQQNTVGQWNISEKGQVVDLAVGQSVQLDVWNYMGNGLKVDRNQLKGLEWYLNGKWIDMAEWGAASNSWKTKSRDLDEFKLPIALNDVGVVTSLRPGDATIKCRMTQPGGQTEEASAHFRVHATKLKLVRTGDSHTVGKDDTTELTAGETMKMKYYPTFDGDGTTAMNKKFSYEFSTSLWNNPSSYQLQDSDGKPVKDSNGKPVIISARGWRSSNFASADFNGQVNPMGTDVTVRAPIAGKSTISVNAIFVFTHQVKGTDKQGKEKWTSFRMQLGDVTASTNVNSVTPNISVQYGSSTSPIEVRNGSTVSMSVGENLQLSYTLSPLHKAYATAYLAHWDSVDKSVATVDSDSSRKLSAINKGTSLITMSIGGALFQFTAAVTEPTLSLSYQGKLAKPVNTTNRTMELTAGESADLHLGFVTRHDYMKLGSMTWTSSNDDIASVNKNSGESAFGATPKTVVTAKKPGTVTITGTIAGRTVKATVKVVNATLAIVRDTHQDTSDRKDDTQVTVSGKTVELTPGENFKLYTKITPTHDYASFPSGVTRTTWTEDSHSNTINLRASGDSTTVYGISAHGMSSSQAVVTAQAGGKTATTTISVVRPTLKITTTARDSQNKGVTKDITNQQIELERNGSQQVAVVVSPLHPDYAKIDNSSITWASASPSVATVSRDSGENNTVQGKTDGSAKIEATLDGRSASTTVKVLASIVSVTSPEDVTTYAGKAPNLPQSVSVKWNNGRSSEEVVNWSKVNPSQYKTAGRFTVTGTVKGYKGTVRVTVQVLGLKNTTPVVTVNTGVGVPPELPATVQVTWSNGKQTTEKVTWDTPQFKQYSKAGTFTLNGYLKSSGSKVTATVVVSVTTQNMYRLYNPNSGEHFYTANPAERANLIGLGWHDEGVGWVAPIKSSEPVYRLYNPNAGDHHYTTNPAERDMLKNAGWSYEGIGWYSATNEGRKPLYREYNPNAKSGAHNFTLNAAEDRYLGTIGWHREGTAWYAVHGL